MSNKYGELNNFTKYLQSTFRIKKQSLNDDINLDKILLIEATLITLIVKIGVEKMKQQ